MRRGTFYLLGIIAAISGAFDAHAIWHDPPLEMEKGIYAIDSIGTNLRTAYLNVRVGGTSNKSAATWGIELGRTSTESFTEIFVDLPPLTNFTDVYSSQGSVALRFWENGLIAKEEVKKFDANGRFYSLKLIYDGVTARLYGGIIDQELLWQIPESQISGKMTLHALTPISCQRLEHYSEFNTEPTFSQWKSIGSLIQHFSESKDPLEGFWQYLDRDISTQYATLGGKYTIAIARQPADKSYDIIYINGAMKEADKWLPMQIKGRLTPTLFADSYDLEWIDVNNTLLDDDNNADISLDGQLLTLRFPLYKSQLRLSRLPLEKLSPDLP